MATRPGQPDEDCARARQWASLRLDSPLSDIESVLLGAHLAGCPACRAFTQSVTSLTAALRAAPLEEAPHAFELPRQHSTSRRGAGFRGLRVASVGVAAAAAALVVTGLLGQQFSPGGVPIVAAHLDRAVIGLKEVQLDALDGVGKAAPRAVRPGLAAAEQITVGAAVATARRQPRTMSRLSPGG
jgi:predicted anti-sigma-YlaC factor YlaD